MIYSIDEDMTIAGHVALVVTLIMTLVVTLVVILIGY